VRWTLEFYDFALSFCKSASESPFYTLPINVFRLHIERVKLPVSCGLPHFGEIHVSLGRALVNTSVLRPVSYSNIPHLFTSYGTARIPSMHRNGAGRLAKIC
jgi:hypothetical protein